MRDVAPGTVIAGYRVEGLIGRGGMGEVYRAHQLALDRPVALKLIASELARDERFAQRFRQEALIAARIDHPNVLPVHEAGQADGRLYLSMRLVDGVDLARRARGGAARSGPRGARRDPGCGGARCRARPGPGAP